MTVPGWTAQPVAVAQTGARRRSSPCRAAKFGTQANSNLRYRVIVGAGRTAR